ncbi:uncharacterized protein At2g29880-like [Telopea speciosissima]|uniref:uncharacterized protein At2g29880-like n=1 Tax=Telopea speciosissima TaxID=54955 RepID=UPI001CC44BF6|nr:uncharacterized protein At2g29880-like [Telopea speciosissima]XP_043721465.1 uncharacterized protein At2g29880-like [Telopea speciosissima]XP_043721466.1 uncharacterized protein At2g29880-like [Telopea speciosissima]XP_043721467.1 uncharacterized protein At2g29880-like [Telopea speciosissima]
MDPNSSQIRNGNTKEKAKNLMWTNEMDRCLTKALVLQVKKGNKIDKSLTSSAYAAAVAVLNEKFALDLNKEHIRNRLKTWKKQYGVLKELLAQSEFQWDERQKMVVANDSVWNEYIKANPDSKASRPSFLENYNDWCMILGDYQPTVSSYRTKVEVDVDLPIDDEHVENADVVQICNGSLKEKGKNMMWTIEMDHCLTKTLVDLVRQSKRKDKVLNNAVYAASAATLNENFGLDLMGDHVRNRLKTWKKRYGVLKELLSQSGFEWDETQKMVVANDSVWNDYVKEHPDARAIRGKIIENYDELCIIFSNDQASGSHSRNGVDSEEHVEAADQFMSVYNDINPGDVGDGMEESSQQTGSQPASSSRSKRPLKRKRANNMMLETMSAMAANIGRIADALGQNSKTVNLDELFDVVQKIPGFDDDLIIEACEYLSVNEKKAMMFLKLDDRLRRIWLLKRLHGHHSG